MKKDATNMHSGISGATIIYTTSWQIRPTDAKCMAYLWCCWNVKVYSCTNIHSNPTNERRTEMKKLHTQKKNTKWKWKNIVTSRFRVYIFIFHSVNNRSKIGHTTEIINMGKMIRECDKFSVALLRIACSPFFSSVFRSIFFPIFLVWLFIFACVQCE